MLASCSLAASSTLSSRAERDRPKDGHAESRDPSTSSGQALLSAGSQQRPSAPASSRSFDSGNELARESVPSAQDDNIEKGTNDAGVFRSLAKAGQRLAEIHIQ